MATRAIIEAGVHVRDPEVDEPDAHYAQKGHVRLDQVPGREQLFTIGFVRHPLDWWRSFWAHRMREGWIFPDHEIDSRASAENFDDFIEQVLANLPGFLTEFFERFVGPSERPISFIGRYERLVTDLGEALRLADQPFDERKLGALPPHNVGDYRSHPAHYRPDLARRLLEAEIGAVRRFYAPPPRWLLPGGRRARLGHCAAALGTARVAGPY